MKGMLPVRTLNILLSLVAVLLLALTSIGSGPVAAQSAGDPCSPALPLPPPPGGHPKPTGGTVTDVSTNLGIEGATVQLYRCYFGVGLLEDAVTTAEDGDYLFEDVELGSYYYIQVSSSGPMAGMQPASGYSNPTPIFDPSEDDTHDFGFE